MAKLDRQGNIKTPSSANKILEVKQPEKPAEIDDTELSGESIDQVQESPQQPRRMSVIYDFVIHCATVSAAGIDMEIVCANCPFRRTECIDTMIIPTATQMADIAKILMMDEGNE